MRRWLTLCASLGAACAAAVATAPGQVATETVVTPARPAEPAKTVEKQAVNVLEAFAKGRAPARADRDRAAEVMRREAQKRMDELEAIHGKIRRIGTPAPVPAAPVAVARPAIVFNVNMDAQAVQFRQQYRPALRAEYERLLSVCEPTKDQRRRIAREGEKAVMDAARKVAQWQRAPHMVNPNGRNPVAPIPRTLIQDALIAAAQAHLSPAQAARYKQEVELRRQDFRLAAAENLVAKLDQTLFLSKTQRETLQDNLVKDWDDSWCQSLQMFLNDTQFFPMIPDKVVTPVLDPAQRKVWQGTQKGQAFYWGDTINAPVDDSPLEDAGQDEPADVGRPVPAPAPGPSPS